MPSVLRIGVLGCVALCALSGPLRVVADPQSGTNSQRSEAEFLVSPDGGAFEISLHPGLVCVLLFPDPVANTTALMSSDDFESVGWGDKGVGIRALRKTASPTTIALTTKTGSVRVNLTFAVVPLDKPAMTLVRFKPSTAQAAFDARVEAAVGARVAKLEAEMAEMRRNSEKDIRNRISGGVAEGLLKRNETIAVTTHGRNGENIVVHVVRAYLVGEEGYLIFDLENRSGHAYRLSKVQVFDGDRDVGGPARLTSITADHDPTIVGIVPQGATGRASVAVSAVDRVLGKNLTLVVSGPDGSQPVRIDRGIVLR